MAVDTYDTWDKRYINAVLKATISIVFLVLIFVISFGVFMSFNSGHFFYNIEKLNQPIFYFNLIITYAFLIMFFLYKAKGEFKID